MLKQGVQLHEGRCGKRAGLLAQRSIQHLTISTPMATRTLAARTTDLPGELLANTPCTLACSEGTFSITSDQIHRISKP
jgi:hypothetical protein